MKMGAWCMFLLFLGVTTHAEPLRDLEIALRGELASLQQELGLPGATAAFVLSDGRVGEVAVGQADRELRQVMTTESRMLAASIGKTFVGATALALAAEGRLDLDAPIASWFQSKPLFPRLPQGDKITVRHLLMHRSGLSDHVYTEQFVKTFTRRWSENENPFTPEDLIGFVVDCPTPFSPGDGWAYSDTGYVLLGLILEDVCGRSLYDEVAIRFLRPLELASTIPSDQRALPGLVPGYTSPQNPFGFPSKTTGADGALLWHPGVEFFGGGWMSTSGDLARWGAALYGGDLLPGSAETELRLTMPVSGTNPAVRYGAGVSHVTEGPLGPTFGHGGWIPGYVSSLRYYSRYGLTVAFQTNTDNIQAERDWLAKMEIRLARVLIPSHYSQGRGQHAEYRY